MNSRKYYVFIPLLLVCLFMSCSNSSSLNVKDLGELAEKYSMLPQYPGHVEEEGSIILAKFEEELECASLDARGLTIPTESVIPGIEVEWPAEETKVELCYHDSPGVRLVLITKLRFTEDVDKAPLNSSNSPYEIPKFYGVAYAGDEPLGLLRPEKYGWMNVPEKFDYAKQVPKGTEVYLKMKLEISCYEPHHYDNISKIVVCSYNSPQAEMYNWFSPIRQNKK